MSIGDVQSLEVQIPHELVQYWGWFLAFGIGLVLLGVAAVVRSVTATVVSMLFFGWLLLLASGIEIAQAVMVGHWVGSSSFAGRDFVRNYGGTDHHETDHRAEVATLFMAMFFLIGGLFQLIGSERFTCRAGDGRRPTASSRWCSACRSHAMAGFGALGHWALCRHRLIFYGGAGSRRH